MKQKHLVLGKTCYTRGVDLPAVRNKSSKIKRARNEKNVSAKALAVAEKRENFPLACSGEKRSVKRASLILFSFLILQRKIPSMIGEQQPTIFENLAVKKKRRLFFKDLHFTL